jgi:hypothetical protein
MVEGKIKGRLVEQGGKFFLVYCFLVHIIGLVIDEFYCTNDLTN